MNAKEVKKNLRMMMIYCKECGIVTVKEYMDNIEQRKAEMIDDQVDSLLMKEC